MLIQLTEKEASDLVLCLEAVVGKFPGDVSSALRQAKGDEIRRTESAESDDEACVDATAFADGRWPGSPGASLTNPTPAYVLRNCSSVLVMGIDGPRWSETDIDDAHLFDGLPESDSEWKGVPSGEAQMRSEETFPAREYALAVSCEDGNYRMGPWTPLEGCDA